MPPRKDAAALRHDRQYSRFKRAYGDLLGAIDESLSERDTEMILNQIEQRVDQASDSVEGFREWSLQETRRLSRLTVTVINNFPHCEDWLLERLAEYTGAADDLESLSRWLSQETDRHEQCKEANAELCKSLFLNDRCTFAVRAGIKSILKGSAGLGVNDALDEVSNLVWLWILDHGEQLRNSPSDANWHGRLYKLAQSQARGWKSSRKREKKKLRSIEPVLAGIPIGCPVDGRLVPAKLTIGQHDTGKNRDRGSPLAHSLQYGAEGVA